MAGASVVRAMLDGGEVDGAAVVGASVAGTLEGAPSDGVLIGGALAPGCTSVVVGRDSTVVAAPSGCPSSSMGWPRVVEVSSVWSDSTGRPCWTEAAAGNNNTNISAIGAPRATQSRRGHSAWFLSIAMSSIVGTRRARFGSRLRAAAAVRRPARRIRRLQPLLQCAMPEPAKATAERSAWHDNMRLVAMFIVVAGHWGIGRGAFPGTSSNISFVIYIFHMPLFIMLAGRFVRPRASFDATFRKGWGQLLVPFAFFFLVDLFVLSKVSGPPFVAFGHLPYGLWFLVSLFFWRLMVVPVGRWRSFDRLVWPLALLGLVLSGLLPNWWSLVRTFAFFPAFLFGMLVLPRLEPHLRRPWVRVASAVLLVATVVVVWPRAQQYNYLWLHQSRSYDELGRDFVSGAGLRLLVAAAGIVVALAVVSLVPTRRVGSLSGLGRFTLYAYLLHLPVTEFIIYWLIPRTDSNAAVSVSVSLAIIPFVLVVMTRPVRRLTQPLVEPVEFAKSVPVP